MAHKADQKRTYPSDVTDEEWAYCAPYLTLMKEDVPQRKYALRTLFNGLRYMVRAGCPWRMLPHDLPPWQAIQQQTLRWIAAGIFEDMAADLRRILRLILERAEEPSAVILDGRTVQSTPESGARAGYDGHKRRKGSKVHIAVDTLGHLLALRVTSADQQERAQVEALAKEVQQATGQSVELAYVDQGYTGQDAADAAATQGIQLEVVKLSTAKRGFVLLPRRWVVERSFAWMARFRRLAKDYERLPQTFAGLHWLAFITLMLGSVFR
ncbi:MAG: IS5 family transposase [Novosphingobium sp.]|jgi:transposase